METKQTYNGMTIDKIKHYISPDLYFFWSNCNQNKVIEARNLLKKEIESLPIMRDIEHISEYYLLCYLSESFPCLTF